MLMQLLPNDYLLKHPTRISLDLVLLPPLVLAPALLTQAKR